MAKLPYNAHGKGESAGYLDDRAFSTRHSSPGVHTVKVWRTKKDGVTLLPGSEYTAQYFVEAPAPVATTSSK